MSDHDGDKKSGVGNFNFPQNSLAYRLFCRRNSLCRGIAAIKLEFCGICFAFAGIALRKLFQVEVQFVERLVLGAGLGTFQLPFFAGDRMVRSLCAGAGDGDLAGGVGGTVAQIAGMDTLSCGETAVERPQKSGISPFIFTVVSGIVVFICGGNCLYFDRVEPFPVVCLE